MTARSLTLAGFVTAAVAIGPGAAFSAQVPQPPAALTGSAELGGVAVSSDRGQPIRRALVRISAADLRGTREIATDDAGRFHFSGLPPGRYTLTARKAGFVESTYGATRRRGI